MGGEEKFLRNEMFLTTRNQNRRHDSWGRLNMNASPTWAGLTQYLGDHIESEQKRALKIIFQRLCYEDALTDFRKNLAF